MEDPKLPFKDINSGVIKLISKDGYKWCRGTRGYQDHFLVKACNKAEERPFSLFLSLYNIQ